MHLRSMKTVNIRRKLKIYYICVALGVCDKTVYAPGVGQTKRWVGMEGNVPKLLKKKKSDLSSSPPPT